MALVPQQNIIDALKVKLTALIPSIPVYDTLTGQNPSMPFVKISIVNALPVYYFDDDDTNILFQLDVFSRTEKGPKSSRVINDSIVLGLHRSTISVVGLSISNIICTNPGSILTQNFIVGGRTQQDNLRLMSEYKLFGSA